MLRVHSKNILSKDRHASDGNYLLFIIYLNFYISAPMLLTLRSYCVRSFVHVAPKKTAMGCAKLQEI
jgi:hypothetical protein